MVLDFYSSGMLRRPMTSASPYNNTQRDMLSSSIYFASELGFAKVPVSGLRAVGGWSEGGCFAQLYPLCGGRMYPEVVLFHNFL